MRTLLTLVLLSVTVLSARAADLFPFVLPWDDATPGVTDLSGWLHKPAGQFGPVRAGQRFTWSAVFPIKPGADIPPEGFLHLPQKQKFAPFLLLERKTISIQNATVSGDETGVGRLSLTDQSTVTQGKPLAQWDRFLEWSPAPALDRLAKHVPGPLDLDTDRADGVARFLTGLGGGVHVEKQRRPRERPQELGYHGALDGAEVGRQLRDDRRHARRNLRLRETRAHQLAQRPKGFGSDARPARLRERQRIVAEPLADAEVAQVLKSTPADVWIDLRIAKLCEALEDVR